MLGDYYKIRIDGHDVKTFFKYLYKQNIRFQRVIYKDKSIIVYVDLENYNKLCSVKTIYDVRVLELLGFNYFKKLVKDNFIFLLSFFIGILYIFFLSNIIFDVEVICDSLTVKNTIYNELLKYDILKYSFVKDYDYIQEVKEKILDSNRDILEWIEIERVGSKYIVRLDRRIKNDYKEDECCSHIVARKNAIIKKIVANSGEVIKKVNDYVSYGDIIISGEIFRGEDIKNNVNAIGSVYGEVFYKASITASIYYLNKEYTNNFKNNININFIGNDFNFLSSFKYKDVSSFNIFSDFYNMFNINFNHEDEYNIKNYINDIASSNFLVNLARNKIEENLKSGEYIISQKKLKTVVNDSTINIEVFFKVYEDISLIKKFESKG